MGDQRISIIVDTGSDLSFISKEIPMVTGVQTLQNPQFIIAANGNRQRITERSKLALIIEHIPSKVFKLDIMVIDSLPVDIILGRDVLKTTESNINFFDNTRSIEGMVIEMSSLTIRLKSPKRLLRK